MKLHIHEMYVRACVHKVFLKEFEGSGLADQ